MDRQTRRAKGHEHPPFVSRKMSSGSDVASGSADSSPGAITEMPIDADPGWLATLLMAHKIVTVSPTRLSESIERAALSCCQRLRDADRRVRDTIMEPIETSANASTAIASVGEPDPVAGRAPPPGLNGPVVMVNRDRGRRGRGRGTDGGARRWGCGGGCGWWRWSAEPPDGLLVTPMFRGQLLAVPALPCPVLSS